MKIETDEKGNIILKEVYSGLMLDSNDGERMSVCMRDSGFEFNYQGVWYSAKEGKVTELGVDVMNHETLKWVLDKEETQMGVIITKWLDNMSYESLDSWCNCRDRETMEGDIKRLTNSILEIKPKSNSGPYDQTRKIWENLHIQLETEDESFLDICESMWGQYKRNTMTTNNAPRPVIKPVYLKDKK